MGKLLPLSGGFLSLGRTGVIAGATNEVKMLQVMEATNEVKMLQG
jgi:hypothetical protein